MTDSTTEKIGVIRRTWKIWLTAAGFAVLLIANGYVFWQIREVRSEFQRELYGVREAIAEEMETLRETTAQQSGKTEQDLSMLREALEMARSQAANSVGQARVEARKRADAIASRLAEQQRQVAGELSAVREGAADTTNRLDSVFGDVGHVRSEVSLTRSELEKTVADLNRVTGDLGVMSGLIATNSEELAALKALGERDYFEFELTKSKQPQRVGDVTIRLKKADQKRGRYTLEVVADDLLIEKKDKTLYEPVQFYVAGARQPYELVVNHVRKDRVAGYLATPRMLRSGL